MKPVIAVLEDMEIRIEWLRAKFPDVEILWSTTVQDFLESLNTVDSDRLALLVFDHDIGGPFEGSTDSQGMTGHNAAKLVGFKNQIPALVWSINKSGAMNILQALKDNQFTMTGWMPFFNSNLDKMKASIEIILRDFEKKNEQH